ncbi:MAG: tRNA (N(6)-L-threonylcarbamoyladenosine(37)-C(2))-methylthiotransferase MtaB [Clostridia bacterium]|nr:tRNA (N(6)-L-threonylcarbamoyladenosine(37)-C(2))-methylthiotransferase MtaB [Clostridia bacterium]MDD4048964.1 tRNA (N(6)-L-threonylcarbamoyladenosine(37)-C(2))-methylthiotransferase MtaB [Clostridia bacterium]
MEKAFTVAFLTLGCKVNQNETEAIIELFREKGYTIVNFEAQADIYVINTCTVTHLADRKSRQMIRRAKKTNPQAKIVATGCYAQIDPEVIKNINGVNLVVGINEKSRIVDLVEDVMYKTDNRVFVENYKDIKEFEEIKTNVNIERARAYIKVQEGCNQFCTYCIIPFARGVSRSRLFDNALSEAEKLIAAGYKEIVVTGIHLGFYGKDFDQQISLEYLLKRFLSINKNVRWRLGSLEPTEVNPELLELMQEYDNFCPHLHLPLQSGHDQILKSMNRPYTTEQYARIVTDIRKAIPNIAITTDIMVGFPGENEEQFKEYLQFVEEMAFSKLHVFKYSPRKGTPAANFPGQILSPVKEARSREMITLGQKLSNQYAEKFMNKVLGVLVEENIDKNVWEGSTANYLKVRLISSSVLRRRIVPVCIKEVKEAYCIGE